ncbi:MAG: hypothetical protein ACRELG_28815 [Gemmataceae bacterium]
MDLGLNPYSPGAGTPPPALVGRDALIESFGVALQRARQGRPGQSLMPIGLRGVGKTVLLNRFIEKAGCFETHTILIEAPEDGNLRQLLVKEARRLLLHLDRAGALSQKVKRALRIFRSFSLKLGPDGSLSGGIDGDREGRGAILRRLAHRVLLSWNINPRWQIETDPNKVSEWEVCFAAETPECTRVEIEHRKLEHHGEGWGSVRDGVGEDRGWPLYLQRYSDLMTREY